MDGNLIQEVFNYPPYRLGTSNNINPNTGYKFHTTYGHTGKTRTHYHEYYEIFLTVKGNVIHCINKTIQILDPGCLVFIRPDDVHGYMYNEGEEYEFVNLAMSIELLEDMIAYIKPAYDCMHMLKSEFPPVSRLTKNETATLLKKLNALNLVQNQNSAEQKLQIRQLILEIFSQYFITRAAISETDLPLWLTETCRLMKKPENFVLGQKRMSEICGKSPEHLSRTMKKYMNLTPTDFINDLKINYAANLLANTNLKISDICYESGFGNISHFYTLFNKAYHKSPKEFRKSTIIEG